MLTKLLKDGIGIEKRNYTLSLDRTAKYVIYFPNGHVVRFINYAEMLQLINNYRKYIKYAEIFKGGHTHANNTKKNI